MRNFNLLGSIRHYGNRKINKFLYGCISINFRWFEPLNQTLLQTAVRGSLGAPKAKVWRSSQSYWWFVIRYSRDQQILFLNKFPRDLGTIWGQKWVLENVSKQMYIVISWSWRSKHTPNPPKQFRTDRNERTNGHVDRKKCILCIYIYMHLFFVNAPSARWRKFRSSSWKLWMRLSCCVIFSSLSLLRFFVIVLGNKLSQLKLLLNLHILYFRSGNYKSSEQNPNALPHWEKEP